MDHDNLSELTWHLGRAYYAYVGLVERILVAEGLNQVIRPGMGHVLFALYEQDDRTIKEIAERTQLAPSTLTGLLKRMERAGLIGRHSDENDGRLVRVRLTDFGLDLEAKCRRMLKRVTRLAHAGVGEQNVPQAKQMLQGLSCVFNEEQQRLATKQCTSDKSRR